MMASSFTFSYSTLAILACVFLLCYVIRQYLLPKPIPGIPYHRASAWKLLGDAPAMVMNLRNNQTVFDWVAAQCAELDSPIVQLFIQPFQKPKIILTDFREGQDIMMRRHKEFDRSKFFGDIFAGVAPYHSIRRQTDDGFRKQRRLVNDTMSSQFLNTTAAPHLHKTMQNLVDLWSEKARLAEDRAFAAGEDIIHLALDAIWAVAFGTEIGTLREQTEYISTISSLETSKDDKAEAKIPHPETPAAYNSIIAVADTLQITTTSPFPIQHHWFIRQFPWYKKAKLHKDRLIEDSLLDAKKRLLTKTATDEQITCATDFMVFREQQAADKEGRKPEYDSPEAKDELFGFLVAGTDTTATTLQWGVKYLADNPHVQRVLRKHLHEAFAEALDENGKPTCLAMAKASVPYLDATVEETLRLANTAPGAVRMAKVDTQVLGYHIPKGTDIFCLSSAYGFSLPDLPVHIDESKRSASSQAAESRTGVWNNNDIGIFKPERWLKTNEQGETEFDMRAGPSMPFGLGPRGCFGKKLAYVEMKIVFCMLVWNFEFLKCAEDLSGYKAVEKLTRSPQQCFVRLRPVENGAVESPHLA